MLCGETPSVWISQAMRCISTRVLPLPAPASTSTGTERGRNRFALGVVQTD